MAAGDSLKRCFSVTSAYLCAVTDRVAISTTTTCGQNRALKMHDRKMKDLENEESF